MTFSKDVRRVQFIVHGQSNLHFCEIIGNQRRTSYRISSRYSETLVAVQEGPSADVLCFSVD